MKKSIILLIILLSSALYAQKKIENANDFQNIVGDTNKIGMWVPTAKPDTSIEGTVYLFPNWEQVCDLKLKNDAIIRLYNLNYNVDKNILESQIAVDSVFQYNLDNFDQIKINTTTYKILNNVLYQEIFDGQKIKCYKGFTVITSPGVFNPLTQAMTKLAKYVIKEHYYYQLDGDLIEFKPSKKSILKLVGDKKELVSTEIKAKKYDLDNDNDIKLLLQFFDAL